VRFSPESHPVPLQDGNRFPQLKVKVRTEELLVEISSVLKVKVRAVFGPFPDPDPKQFPPAVFPPTTNEVVPVTLFGDCAASDRDKALAPVEVYPQGSPGSPPWKPTVTCAENVLQKASEIRSSNCLVCVVNSRKLEKWRKE
jgi:hypothetical protein